MSFSSCTGNNTPENPQQEPKKEGTTPKKHFKIDDYFKADVNLDHIVDEWYNSLSDTQRIAQMIMTSAGQLGKPNSTVLKLVRNQQVGGVIFLKGQKTENKAFIDQLNQETAFPLWFAIDAEPSLFNSRVLGTDVTIPKTVDLKDSTAVADAAHKIDAEIKEMGFQINFAPVVDLSPNNEAIKHRSFGSNPDSVIQKSSWFIEATQKDQVAACIKHFPGHGYVTGDTHKQTVYIDGEFKEIGVYPPLITENVASVMVAHVTVQNNTAFNTDGKPASCSRNIVTELLRDSLGFEGIIFTDAMNMMAAVNSGEMGPLAAAKAGCDVILMPPNEPQLLQQILELSQTDQAFAAQIENSIKRILRMKICLGLYQPKA